MFDQKKDIQRNFLRLKWFGLLPKMNIVQGMEKIMSQQTKEKEIQKYEDANEATIGNTEIVSALKCAVL